MSDFIVAITGGIASGKSEVSRRFEALGIDVADADIAARRVVESADVLDAIASALGPQALQPDGQLDRQGVRQMVFADPGKRQALEAITHPAIRQLLHDTARASTGPYAIAAIPLLAEAGGRKSYPWLDRIVVVDTPVQMQLERLMRRDGIDEALAERMVAAQASREQRLAIADAVIVNDGDPSRLDGLVAELDQRFRQQAATAAHRAGSGTGV